MSDSNRPSEGSMGFAKRVMAISIAAMVFGLVLRGAGSGGDSAPNSSAENVEPGGWAAAYRLLEALGVEVALWDRPPADLPSGPGLLWMAQPPEDYADLLAIGGSGAEGDPGGIDDPGAGPEAVELDPAVEALARAGHHPSHYRRFVGSGGILLLPSEEASLEFLATGLGYTGFDSATLGPGKSHGDAVVLPDGSSFEVARLPRRWRFPRYDRVRGEAFARRRTVVSGGGTPWVEFIPLGRGGVVLHPLDAVLRNGAIGEAEHAALLVALCRELGSGAPVYFDEYALGRGREWGLLELVFGGPARPAALHGIALALVALWWFATPRAFRRDSPDERRRATEERVRSRAGWMARDDAQPATFDRATEAVLRRLVEEAGGASSIREDGGDPGGGETGQRGDHGEPTRDEDERRRRIHGLFRELSRVLGFGEDPPDTWPLNTLLADRRSRSRGLREHYRSLDAFEAKLRMESRLGTSRASTPGTRGERLSP